MNDYQNYQNYITFKFFGVFTISCGEKHVSIKATRNRVKKLLGLLILTDEQYTDAALIDHIWADNPSKAADSDLTNLVYLTRQTLAKVAPGLKCICRRKGRYFWNPDVKYDTDLAKMDRLYLAYRHAKAITDSKTVKNTCREMVELYDGTLADTFDGESWVLPMSRHYNNVYLTVATDLCDTLALSHKKEDIEELSEVALKSARYGETMRFYEYYFDALKSLGRKKAIVRAYKKISKTHVQETGEGLSDAIKRIYNWADESRHVSASDLDKLVADLREPTADGEIKNAYYCDRQMFLTMAHFVMRNALRDGKVVVVLIIGFKDARVRPRGKMETAAFEERMTALEDGIRNTMRKDDVFTRLSPSQYIVLPFDCDPDQVDAVKTRLLSNLSSLNIDITALKLTADDYQVI